MTIVDLTTDTSSKRPNVWSLTIGEPKEKSMEVTKKKQNKSIRNYFVVDDSGDYFCQFCPRRMKKYSVVDHFKEFHELIDLEELKKQMESVKTIATDMIIENVCERQENLSNNLKI